MDIKVRGNVYQARPLAADLNKLQAARDVLVPLTLLPVAVQEDALAAVALLDKIFNSLRLSRNKPADAGST